LQQAEQILVRERLHMARGRSGDNEQAPSAAEVQEALKVTGGNLASLSLRS
jgi:hypothetical protein